MDNRRQSVFKSLQSRALRISPTIQKDPSKDANENANPSSIATSPTSQMSDVNGDSATIWKDKLVAKDLKDVDFGPEISALLTPYRKYNWMYQPELDRLVKIPVVDVDDRV